MCWDLNKIYLGKERARHQWVTYRNRVTDSLGSHGNSCREELVRDVRTLLLPGLLGVGTEEGKTSSRELDSK